MIKFFEKKKTIFKTFCQKKKKKLSFKVRGIYQNMK